MNSLVTGIAPRGDPKEINRALRADRLLDGLRMTIIGSSSRGDVAQPWDHAFVHTGIVEIVDGGSAYPHGTIHTGQSGTGVPGITSASPSMTFIEHPTVFDYLVDLKLPHDLAVNYNLAIEAGRNVVVCEVPDAQAGSVAAAFHVHGLRNVHAVEPAPVEAALV